MGDHTLLPRHHCAVQRHHRSFLCWQVWFDQGAHLIKSMMMITVELQNNIELGAVANSRCLYRLSDYMGFHKNIVIFTTEQLHSRRHLSL